MWSYRTCGLWISLSLFVLCGGCIDDPTAALGRDTALEGGADLISEAGGARSLGGGEQGGGEQGGGEQGGGSGEDTLQPVAGGEPTGGEPTGGEPTGGELMVDPVDPPPPSEELRPCERFCERAQDCLYPSCEALAQIPPRQFCEGWCSRDNGDWLNQSAELSCQDFNERVYGFSPEVRALCLPLEESRCEQICDFGEVCGLVSEECLINCEGADLGAQLCFSGAATLGDCGRFLQCLQGGPGPDDRPDDRPDINQICAQLCGRESQCVLDSCAPGVIDGGYTEACFEGCVATRDPRLLQARSQLSCEELVAEARASDAELDERCDLSEEAACATLCSSVISPCGEREAEACEVECAEWSDARFVCLARATQCEEVNTCLLPEEEAARCDRLCTHLEDCILEACPPRIIPPQLISSCSADCFRDPVSEEDLTSWEGSSCRDVRDFVYRDNPQLRPICEGNQDFRPSPEECSAFCAQSLGACLIGGDALCLSACASFTRPQYECSLAAQGDCAAIDLCLSEP